MKKFLLLTLLTVSLAAHAQKVDMDRYWFSTSSRYLPSHPLPEGSRTYRVEVTTSSVVSGVYSNESLKSQVAIDGFKYTEPSAHLNIYLFFSDLNFQNSSITSRKEEIKDKDGKVTGSKMWYSATANYRFGVEVTVKDSNMNVLDQFQPYSTSNLLTYTSQEYLVANDAANYFNNNVGEIKRGLAKQLVDNALVNIRGAIKNKYGYAVMAYKDYLWILDSKKHPEYKQHQEMWDLLKATTAKLNGAEAISEQIKNELKPAMEYFESLRTKYAGDAEKTNKKFRHCSYYAMSRIHLLLDNPEAALKEADLLIANDFDVKDAEPLKRDANTMIDRFKKNGVTSTHFPIDVNVNKGPAR
jgi:hypothetical protein